jgi:glycosyltransferase involved in cell wall biosynthesis
MTASVRIGMTTLGADRGQSGIGTYVLNLIREFDAMALGDRLELVSSASEYQHFAPAPASVSTIAAAVGGGPLPELLWHQAGLPRLVAERRWDVLFLPAGNRRLAFRSPCPMVGTVHDLASSHLRDKYDPIRSFYNRRVIPGLIRRLAHVITVSECSKRDIVRYAGIEPDRITVIPNGVDHRRFRLRDKELAATRVGGRFGVDGPFLLYVARLEHPAKNHVRLIRAFDRLKAATGIPHQLVLAGPDWSGAEAIHAEVRTARFAADIRTLGFVAAGDLPDLYAAAELLVFPSLYEGFGIPLIEAMAMGTAVASSNAASLPEVGGDAAVYFDPRDERAMAETMERLLADTALAGNLRSRGLVRAAGFTWRRTAMATLDVLTRTAEAVHG